MFANPCGLNAFPRSVQKLQSVLGRSPGLKNCWITTLRAVSSSLITVARPHGNFTRFPILPIYRGTQMLSNTKNSPDRRGRYHASDERVKYLPGVADGKQSRGRERLRPVIERVEDFPFLISYLSVVIYKRRDAQMENYKWKMETEIPQWLAPRPRPLTSLVSCSDVYWTFL
jgi:hypothetical protein